MQVFDHTENQGKRKEQTAFSNTATFLMIALILIVCIISIVARQVGRDNELKNLQKEALKLRIEVLKKELTHE